MSKKYNEAELRKVFTGKKISDKVRGKLREDLGVSSLDSGTAKRKLIQKLRGKHETGRKEVYKKLGLKTEEQKSLEKDVKSNDVEDGDKDKELSDPQKRRNIFESRRSSQSSQKGGGFAGSSRGSSGTRYKESSAQFSGGEVNISSLEGTLRNPKGGAGGFAKQSGPSSGGGNSGSGFAKKKGGGGGMGNSPSQPSSSSGRKPLGF